MVNMLRNTRKENEKLVIKRGSILYAIITIVALIGGLFFLSDNITGNVVTNLDTDTSNLVGVSLFVIGLIGAFFYFKSKK